MASVAWSDALADALKSALEAGPAQALDVLDSIAEPMLAAQSRPVLLAGHLDALLRLPLSGRPWACLVVAAVLWETRRDRDGADTLIGQAVAAFSGDGDSLGRGAAASLRGAIALQVGDLREASTWWRAAQALLPDDAPGQEVNLSYLSLTAYQEGDIRVGRRLAEEAHSLAQERGNERIAAEALVYAAFMSLNFGEFARADAELDRASRAYEDMATEQRVLYPIVHIGRGVLHALRGQFLDADERFDEAIRLAEALEIEWFASFGRAVRAEFLVSVDPVRADAEARRALDTFAGLGDVWWRSWALRARALAAGEFGQTRACSDMLERLLAEPLNPLERGRTLLALGEALGDTPDSARASAALEEAAALFEGAGADYFLMRAYVRIAALDTGRRDELMRRAAALGDGDVAYRRVLAPPGRLAIAVLGSHGVWLAGEPVRFRSVRAEQLVHMLALRAPRRLARSEIFRRLWPGAEPQLGFPRVRNALWEARAALGSEGWRLGSTLDEVSLDMEGVTFDLGDARALAMSALEDPDAAMGREQAHLAIRWLSPALLPAWSYEDWVMDQDQVRSALVFRLEPLVG